MKNKNDEYFLFVCNDNGWRFESISKEDLECFLEESRDDDTIYLKELTGAITSDNFPDQTRADSTNFIIKGCMIIPKAKEVRTQWMVE